MSIQALGGGGGSSRYQALPFVGPAGHLTLGGNGASVQGDFAVTPGETLTVLTGGQGTPGGSPYAGSGGGASLVWTGTGTPTTSTLLVEAGGGGGASQATSGVDATAPSAGTGVTVSDGAAGSNAGGGSGGAGGTGGNAGSGGAGGYALMSRCNAGGGGGGASLISSGGDGGAGTPTFYSNAIPGGTGGTPLNLGGGPGSPCYDSDYRYGGGGGGAGYNGGGGGGGAGSSYAGGGGGGGGSYNAGTQQDNTGGVNGDNGRVVISWTPAVTNLASITIGNSQATLGGIAVTGGGYPVTDRGVVYAPAAGDPDPQIGDGTAMQASAGTGLGTFTVPVTGLTPNTLYNYTAYVTSAAGTVYTSVVSFMTGGLTSLTVSPVSGTHTDLVDLSATLKSGGSGVSGRTITFSLDGTTLCGGSTGVPCPTTNSGGVATLSGVSLLHAVGGSDPTGIAASFSGDDNYLPSSGTAALTLVEPALYVSTTGSDSNVCWSADIPCATLTRALALSSAGTTIHIAAGTYNNVQAQITVPVTLAGDGASTTVLHGAVGSSILTDPASDLTISGLTFANASTSGNGGAIAFETGFALHPSNLALTVTDTVFSNDHADAAGGAVYAPHGFLSFTRTIFSGNSAGGPGTFGSGQGGAIGSVTDDGTQGAVQLTISQSEFDSNRANYRAGAVATVATMQIDDSTFWNNSTAYNDGTFGGNAGAIYDGQLSPDSSITNSTFVGNSGSAGSLSAGAIMGSYESFQGSIFAGNSPSNCAALDGTTNTGYTDYGYNLTDSRGNCGLTSSTSLTNTDPKVTVDAGGIPAVQLSPGSPAIDAIPTSSGWCSSNDQIGSNRPDAGESACDIGAYEYVGPDTESQSITFTPTAPTGAAYGDVYTPTATATSGLTVALGAHGACTYDHTTGVVTMTGVGDCTVTADQSGNSAYSAATQVTQTFSVGKKPLTLVVSHGGITYGDPVPTSFTFVYTGWVGSDTATTATSGTPACATAYTATSPVGSYAISCTLGTFSSTNYRPTDGTGNALQPDSGSPVTLGTLTVGQAAQATLTVVAPTRGTYGQTYTLTSTGGSGTGAISYDVGTSSACAVGTGGSADQLTITSDSGVCTVTAHRAGDTNYLSATSVPVTVTVIRADQTITFTAPVGLAYGAPDFALGAMATSGLGVSYISSTISVCTIVNGKVHIVTAGGCTITASQGGDNNYNAAPSVVRTFTIARAASTVALVSSATPSILGQAVTYTATASSTAGTPSGTVTFKDGTTTFGTGTLNGSGVATYTTKSLQIGTYTVTALYGGSPKFEPSTGTGVNQQVQYGVKVLSTAHLTVVVQLQNASLVNLSASTLPVTAQCVVTSTATRTSCASSLVTLGKAFVSNHWGPEPSYAFSINPKGLTKGVTYFLLVQAGSDPLLHAIQFTV